MQNANPCTSRRFNLLSAALAFLLWGGWAYYVNRGHDATIGIFSGLVQGTASFTITLVLVHAVTWLFRRIRGRLLQVILPAAISVTCTGSLLTIIHYLSGTPAILLTITPALSVAFIFCIITSIKLQRFSEMPAKGK